MDPIETLKQQHPFKTFVNRVGGDTISATALIAATLVALVWANIGGSYQELWESPASISVAGSTLELTLADWVNDGLMALFFFLIGLDVRREMSLGDLRRPAQATLPIAAAVGGLLVPAAIFLAINHSGPSANAWGAVIATDSAFALGMLALIGPRRAVRLRVFLLALSIVDDIGALLVLAFFYTSDLKALWLVPVLVGLVLVRWIAKRGVWRAAPYVVIGLAVWFCTFQSGVHATLAGVLLAMLLPVYPTRMDDVDSATTMSRLFRQAPRPESAERARRSLSRAVPLNQRISGLLEPYVNFAIVPLFALANAGVVLNVSTMKEAATSSLTWGIIVALVVGKFIGITGASALVLKLRPSAARPGLDLPRIAGVGGLGGMGFTISLLVIELGIDDPKLADEAKIGVLVAAVLALALGWAVFTVGNRLKPIPPSTGLTLPRPVDTERDHLRGPIGAPAQLVVYADMGEIYRRRTIEALLEVRKELGDELVFVYRHNVRNDNMVPYALALEAAAAQGQFWPIHDALVLRHELPSAAEFLAIADEADLDLERLRHEVRTFEHLSRIEQDSTNAADSGLSEDPAIYVNGARLDGPASAAHILLTLRRARDEAQS